MSSPATASVSSALPLNAGAPPGLAPRTIRAATTEPAWVKWLLIVIRLEEYDYNGAAAIGIAMLAISFALLLAINAVQILSRRRIGYV